jgi:FixJ family two-component response regulator
VVGVMGDGRPICVIDDDPSVRRGLERLLRSVGYQVETFDSGKAFLQQGDIHRPACLILDARMPGQTGLELQEVLVAAGCQVPIVFITGHGDIPMAVQAMKAGAVDFLSKPVDEAELLQAVCQAIGTDGRASRSVRRPPGTDEGVR